MGFEVEFTKEEIELPGYGKTLYEWAAQDCWGLHRLIFHFFLGKGEENARFKAALQKAGEASVLQDVLTETFYTPEFDGHDLLLSGIRPHAKLAIKVGVLKRLQAELEK
ncbi:MAG: hypothetical protein ABFE07_29270 [Armatimonadia bacterium]